MKVHIVTGNTKDGDLPDIVDGEIWGLNAIRPEWVPRWDRMFNLHRHEHLVRDWPKGLKKEKKWVAENPAIPFYVIGDWPKEDYPFQVEFPRQELDHMPRSNYHAGSFDWMVAFAIHLGARGIYFYRMGLNMESGEPISARACLEYWCGYAEGLGVKVIGTRNCDIFHQFHLVKSNSVYGYDDIQLVEDRNAA